MTDVRWSDKAVADLEAIHAYISRDSAHYAAAVARSIVEAVDRLESFPLAGRVVPEIGDETLRELVWKRYRIVYRVHDSTVDILTVHDSARLFPGV